jgi:SNF2 family DNA or RNA helicase
MGQTRNVLVYRLLCEDTIEEQIDEILAVKEQIFNDFADESEVAKADELLNSNTMKMLVQNEKEKHLHSKK